MFRTTLARSVRTFSTVRPLQRGPVEMGKDALKAADNVASKAAIKGLDAGEAAKDTIVEATQKMTGKAEKSASETEGDAAHLAGQAKGKVSEMASKTEGKTSELAGKAKGKMAEMEGKAKKATY